MIRQSFTLRVLSIVFLLIALPLLIYSFIFFQESYKNAIDEAKTELREITNLHTFTLASVQPIDQVFLKEVAYLLDLNKPIDELDAQKINAGLAEVVQVEIDFQLFLLTLKDEKDRYKIVASSLPTDRGQEFFSAVRIPEITKKGEGVFFRYIFSSKEKRAVPYVFIVRVLRDENTGEPVSVLMVSADIEKEISQLFSEMKGVRDIDFAFLTDDGVAFAASDPNLRGDYFHPLSPERREEIHMSQQLGSIQLPKEPLPVIQKQDSPFFEFIFNDEVQIAYLAQIPELNISLLGYSNKGIFFGKAIRHFLIIYCLYGVILLAGGAFAFWIAQWISHPLRQLSGVMGEVRQGNLDVRFKEERFGYEINLLGTIFNSTLDTLFDTMSRAQDERIKKESYQKEVVIGQQVQKNLLPLANPQIEGASVAAIHHPAQEAGGIYYSYLKREIDGEEVLYFSVAEAAGKGVSACLYALAGRSLIQTYATYLDDVGEILSRANNTFLHDTGKSGMFMTTILASYHTRSKRLSYYSCGHIPGLICRKNGEIESLELTGVAVGIEISESWQAKEVQLESGDSLLLFTEGLIKVVNGAGEALSMARLYQFLREEKWRTATHLIARLDKHIEQFTGKEVQEEEVIAVSLTVE